jgi:twitching motility two-component system response regulator PilH
MAYILVVDDSPTVQQVIAGMLTEGGHEVLTAMDGEEAVQLTVEMHPDLVLLDVILPKLNGYQVCRQIKSMPETADIPVAMLTRKAKESDRQWGMEQGADEYITKPFDANDLLAAIERLIPQTS